MSVRLGAALAALLVAALVVAATEKPPAPTASAEAPVSVPAREVPPVGEKLTKTDEQWKAELSPEQYHVLREEGTERAFTGKWWDEHRDGLYTCAACGAPLFSSKDKFDSGTGWPSYTRPVEDGRVGTRKDRKLFMVRTEVHCERCGGHLGHVFDDGPPPTGLRYCINSVSLDFQPTAP